jgi:hypothetical protein
VLEAVGYSTGVGPLLVAAGEHLGQAVLEEAGGANGVGRYARGGVVVAVAAKSGGDQ